MIKFNNKDKMAHNFETRTMKNELGYLQNEQCGICKLEGD